MRLSIDAIWPHRAYLLRVARRIVGRDDAEDVVQDAMMAALASDFRGASTVRSWLHRITVNAALSFRRRRLCPRRGGKIPALPVEELVEHPAAPSGELCSEAHARIDRAWDGLTTREDRQLLYALFLGFSTREIARWFAIPEQTAKSRVFRLRRRLEEAA